MINETLEYSSQGLDLSEEHAYKTMTEIMEGQWTPSQIAALLMSLKIKGESVSEITGFVKAMRDKMTSVAAPANAIDTCGTGGDGLNTFNVSTAAAFVAAAAGAPVAKHGNRSVSSKSGSADILNALGAKIDINPEKAQECLEKVGITFLFAPIYHSSMKHAIVPRKEMGIRTVFNILGPMSNPAFAKRQFVGAFNLETAEKIVKVLQNVKSKHVLAVHSQDGLDELSLSNCTDVFELKHNAISNYTITPEDFGFVRATIADIKGGSAEENAQLLVETFQGKKGAIFDITALNGGAAIYVAGRAEDLKDGVEMAKEILVNGSAKIKLDQFVEFTNS